MTPARGSAALVVLLLSLMVACRRGDPEKLGTTSASASASASAPRAAIAEPPRLPEDPVEARKAHEQWRRHLVEEERERRQTFDRAHEKEHDVVLAGIRKARARYDTAKTKAQVRAAQASFHASLAELKKAVDAVNPDRQSSNLQGDYDAILASLDAPYPAALALSLGGDQKDLTRLRADLDARLEKARAWLAESEPDEHERESGHEP